MDDWADQIHLGGEVRWAPFGETEQEELRLRGYRVSAIDECGAELVQLGAVPVRSGMSYEPGL